MIVGHIHLDDVKSVKKHNQLDQPKIMIGHL